MGAIDKYEGATAEKNDKVMVPINTMSENGQRFVRMKLPTALVDVHSKKGN
jgi:hypothetical protein